MPDSSSTTIDIQSAVEERIKIESELVPVPEIIKREIITPEFVAACLDYNELGDGILYTALNRDQLINVKRWDKRPWLKWADHHWQRDEMGYHRVAVEKVAKEYMKAGANLVEPIKRERSLLDQSNSGITGLKKRLKELEKSSDSDNPVVIEISTELKQAETDARMHAGKLKSLQRQQKDFYDRADRLRTVRGATNCLDWSHHHEQPLAIYGRELDQKPWLLACPNGVINLQTGEFRAGRPSDYLLRTVDVDWPAHLGEHAINHYMLTGKLPDGTDPHPQWTKFKSEIQPDREVLDCMDRIMGYAVTGFGSREQFIAVYLGKGRNGKGTYFNTIQRIMGELAWAIQPEFILEEKNPRSSASASPDIVMIQGRRIIIASENDEKQRISAAKVKRYTGGNKINARGLFAGEEENFSPSWTMFLETNHVPEGLTKDFAMRQRLILIDFPWLYVDDPEDAAQREPWLKKRFKKKDRELEGRLIKEDPYILLDMVRCCLLWQAAGGINAPDKIKASVEELATQEDVLQQFINTCCITAWSPNRIYQEGDTCHVPDGDEYPIKYRACDPVKGEHPEGSNQWERVGLGVKPDNQTAFKEFYNHFKAFYEETQSDKDTYRITKKEVGKRLRERGYDVRNRGRGTVITGPLELLPTIE